MSDVSDVFRLHCIKPSSVQKVQCKPFLRLHCTITLIRACFMAEIFVEIQLLHQFGLSLFCILYAWYWCGKHLKVFSTICCFSAVDIQRYPYTPQTWLECKNHRVIAGYTRLYFGKKLFTPNTIVKHSRCIAVIFLRITDEPHPIAHLTRKGDVWGGGGGGVSFVSANLTKVLLL